MIIYKLNGLDFSKLVYGTPSLYKKTGKGDKLVVSNIRISVINDYLIFSPENEESFLYQQRSLLESASCTRDKWKWFCLLFLLQIQPLLLPFLFKVTMYLN